jgi:hypothetical protein
VSKEYPEHGNCWWQCNNNAYYCYSGLGRKSHVIECDRWAYTKKVLELPVSSVSEHVVLLRGKKKKIAPKAQVLARRVVQDGNLRQLRAQIA